MRSKILKTPLPYLAIFLAHLIWGANFVVAKVTLQEIPVMSLGFMRFALASILIIPFLFTLAPAQRKIKLKHLLIVFAAGLLLVTFNIVFFYEGLIRTEAINSSALMLIIPVLSVLGSWIFLREKIYLVIFLGIILGLLGAAAIIGIPLFFAGSLASTDFLGNTLTLLSAVAYVAGAILAQKILKLYSPLLITANLFLVGAVTFFIPAGIEYLQNPTWTTHVSILGILGFFYIAILSSICAYFLLMWGISKTNAVQANLLQYMEPAIAAALAVPFLGERISYSFIIGTCLIVLGVYWGTLGKSEHHHPHHRAHRI